MSRTYLIEGMTCQHCAGSVTREVSAVAGVAAAEVDLAANTLTVEGTASDDAIAGAVAEAGYAVAGRR